MFAGADLAGVRLVVPGEDRPHRAVLARALRDAGVPWEVAVEANGWELMLRFVALEIGLSVVNACCRIPAGLCARPLPTLPRLRYHVLTRPGKRVGGAAETLATTLIAAGSSWQVTG